MVACPLQALGILISIIMCLNTRVIPDLPQQTLLLRVRATLLELLQHGVVRLLLQQLVEEVSNPKS